MMWVELLQVAGSWSRFCLLPEYWRFLTCVMQLRGRHRVDSVRRPKFDFHTALDVQLHALPPRHDVDVGDIGLIEFLGTRLPRRTAWSWNERSSWPVRFAPTKSSKSYNWHPM